MIRKRLVLVLIAGFALLSCNTNNSKTDQETEVVSHEEDHHHDDGESIALNNGQKWKVNEEMTPYLLEGEKLVNSYIESNGTDYKKLAKDIEEQNSQLIKSCTMDGKSHDELHKWLHPHLELVAALIDAENGDESSKLVNQLKESYTAFHQYFE